MTAAPYIAAQPELPSQTVCYHDHTIDYETKADPLSTDNDPRFMLALHGVAVDERSAEFLYVGGTKPAVIVNDHNTLICGLKRPDIARLVAALHDNLPAKLFPKA